MNVDIMIKYFNIVINFNLIDRLVHLKKHKLLFNITIIIIVNSMKLV